jgi:XTP/dITP diphosphohydrolase
MHGEPGIYSARFMGAATSYPDRFNEIFRRLQGQPRDARFIAALAVARGNEILFETETAVEGAIAHAAAGDYGFGYDPIFFYAPFNMTTAQLADREKSIISHRARAFRNLRRWLAFENRDQVVPN